MTKKVDSKNNKTHIVELDGLRGLAVLTVMIYHFNFIEKVSNNPIDCAFNFILSAGWIGVDMFFVLSGFLITGILINRKGTNNYFGSFYYRRTLRIFPLYYIYLIALFIFFYPFIINKIGPVEVAKIKYAQSIQLWFWFYLSNIKQALNGAISTAGSSHLWSLAIEEQFYLIWPMVVYFTPGKYLKQVSIGVILFSLATRVFLYYIGWDAQSIYIFTLTRVDGLAFGSLIAITCKTTTVNKKTTYLLYSLLVGIVVIFYFFGADYHGSPVVYLFSYTMLAGAFALLVLLLQSDNNEIFMAKPFFKKRWLVFLGKYSYALYMFHPFVRFVLAKFIGKPLLVFNSEIPWQMFFFACCLIVSIIISQISWHLYEKHFLKLKDKMKEGKSFPKISV